MSDTLLTIDNLQTRLGSGDNAVRAVDGVSFEIKRGETFALLGESGCGKSMTALSVMRLLPQPAGHIVDGSVRLDGTDLLNLSEVQMRSIRGGKIGMIFQEPMSSLNPVLTVGEQIAESVRLHQGLKGDAASKRVLELLDAVGIPDSTKRINEYPHQLSGGMKQRVMIAIALAGEPELLIADEPTTALDVTIQAQVLDLLVQLQKDTGMAILLITHDLGVVAQMADRVAVMYAGQVVEQASREQFFSAPQHPYSRKLFDSLPDMQKRDQALAVIPGTVPSLNRDFSSCRFADRCDRKWNDCEEHAPAWQASGPRDGIRCLLADPRFVERAPAAQAAAKPVRSTVSKHTGDVLLSIRDMQVHFPIHKGILKRRVGSVHAVDGVSLDISTASTLALVGESGCGKTTVGKGVLQLVRPTGGSVQFDNVELTTLKGARLREQRKEFQIIFQDPFSSLNPRMRVGDIIEEGMLAQGIGKNAEERRKRVDDLMDHVGLRPEHRDRYPHQFSGGQRQRICVARALAVNPRLIVCDEPTSALDVSVQAQILNLLKSLQEEFDLAYLFITHDLSVVAYLADEVAVMYLGRIVEQGTTKEVLENAQHPYTRALLSAVPKVDQETGRRVIHLEGDMPSPINPPQGCHFHPRCPEATDACRKAYPGKSRISDSHEVRCFLYGGQSS